MVVTALVILTKNTIILFSECLLRFGVLHVFVLFCKRMGHFVMVPLNLTCLNCWQHLPSNISLIYFIKSYVSLLFNDYYNTMFMTMFVLDNSSAVAAILNKIHHELVFWCWRIVCSDSRLWLWLPKFFWRRSQRYAATNIIYMMSVAVWLCYNSVESLTFCVAVSFIIILRWLKCSRH